MRPAVQRRRGRRRRATGRRQLLEQELHSHPHELDQLRVGALVGLQILAGIDPGARDFGEVAHDLAGLARQPGGVRDAAGAQSVEKTLTPFGERRGARIDRFLVPGQQQLELHVRLQQRLRGARVQLAQRRHRGCFRASLGQDLAQPVLEAVARRAAQTTGEHAVRLGGVGERARPGEEFLDADVVGKMHARNAHYN